MPLYDMLCEKCQLYYEVTIPLTELHKKVKCPKCKKILRRKMSAPKVIRIN